MIDQAKVNILLKMLHGTECNKVYRIVWFSLNKHKHTTSQTPCKMLPPRSHTMNCTYHHGQSRICHQATPLPPVSVNRPMCPSTTVLAPSLPTPTSPERLPCSDCSKPRHTPVRIWPSKLAPLFNFRTPSPTPGVRTLTSSTRRKLDTRTHPYPLLRGLLHVRAAQTPVRSLP